MQENNNIRNIINNNYLIFGKVNELSAKITISSDSKRKMLLAGFFNTFRTHFISITILIEKKLYSSAFALIRVMFDSMVRALSMYHTYSDEEIESIYDSDNWKFDKTVIMCKKLDEIYGDNFFEEVRFRAYGGMCDYTHTGAVQIARNFNQDKGTIELDFSDDLILDTLQGTHRLMKIFSLTYFEEVGLMQDEITKEEIEFFTTAFKKAL